MSDITLILGFAGALIGLAAYGPQILQIHRDKRADGISITAWSAWLVSALLVIPHAVAVGDLLFIVLQALTVLSCLAVLALALRYRRGG